ncbi:unnamed protein product, partial [Brassica rapa subsp. narinosa]
HLIRLRRSYIPISVSFLEKPYYLTLLAFNVGYGDPAAEPRPGGARDPTRIEDLRVVGVGEEKERASPNGEAAAESSDGLLGIKVKVILDWDSIGS